MFRSRKRYSPTAVRFEMLATVRGNKRPACFAVCLLGDTEVGPVWGHGARSVTRARMTLGRRCECGRPHRIVESTGEQVGVAPGEELDL